MKKDPDLAPHAICIFEAMRIRNQETAMAAMSCYACGSPLPYMVTIIPGLPVVFLCMIALGLLYLLIGVLAVIFSPILVPGWLIDRHMKSKGLDVGLMLRVLRGKKQEGDDEALTTMMLPVMYHLTSSLEID